MYASKSELLSRHHGVLLNTVHSECVSVIPSMCKQYVATQLSVLEIVDGVKCSFILLPSFVFGL